VSIINPLSQSDAGADSSSPTLSWVTHVSFWRDPLVAKQLAFVIVFPLLVLFGLLLALEWPVDRDEFWWVTRAVLLIAALILFLYAFVIVGLLRGRIATRYTVDSIGFKEESAGFLKYMNVVRWLLLLSGKPTFMGVGLLARGSSAVSVPWSEVDAVAADDQQRTITLYGGDQELMVVRCNDNYDDVVRRATEAGLRDRRRSR